MRKNELLALLKEQLQHEERETEVYARKVRETEHSVVKLVYAKLMRDSIHHADVLNSAITYLAKDEWESAPLKESRDELLRLMNLEEEALRLFTTASAQVTDPHLKSLLTMLAFDEEQHYAMLRYVLENFVNKKETIAT
jgi:rubrerythrin